MSTSTAESRVRPHSPTQEISSQPQPSSTATQPEYTPREPIPPSNAKEVEHCLTCRQVGVKEEMFHCMECLHDFHPTCISDYPVQSSSDIRLSHFICPPCALDKARQSRLPRRRKKQWNSDSD